MADNRSLDEFLGAEEPSEAEADARETPVDEAADPDGEGGEHEVEPMAETFAWSGSGGECERCGEAVEERWRDGAAMVCVDCKAW